MNVISEKKDIPNWRFISTLSAGGFTVYSSIDKVLIGVKPPIKGDDVYVFNADEISVALLDYKESKEKTVYSEVAKSLLESLSEIDTDSYARKLAEKIIADKMVSDFKETMNNFELRFAPAGEEQVFVPNDGKEYKITEKTCSACKWFAEQRTHHMGRAWLFRTCCKINPPEKDGFPSVQGDDFCSKWEADKCQP